MRCLIFLLFALTYGGIAYSALPVVGTWELESFIRIKDDGKEVPWCKNPIGLLTYTADGFMSAAINCAKDTPPDAPSQAYGNRLLYAGTYWIEGLTTVVHLVKNSSDLAIIGKKMPRTIKSISNKELTLEGNAANGNGSFRIVWRRAQRVLVLDQNTMMEIKMSKPKHTDELGNINKKIIAEGESLPIVRLKDGSPVQTGTVATMLFNIKKYDQGERGEIEKELELAVPTLIKVGLFDLFPPEDWIKGGSAGRRFVGEKAREYQRTRQ